MPLPPIRTLLARPVTAAVARRPIALPPWLLLPGLATLVAALAAYVQYIRNYPIWGKDLEVYLGGVNEFRHGRSAYAIDYGADHLPYTYPPVSLLTFAPLSVLSHHAALYAMIGVGVAATFATAWLTLGMLGYTGTEGRIGVSAAVTALMLWCEPFQLTFNLGQVNIVLMLLVVADFARPDHHRSKGALIGVATAVKLVPAIFVLYLLLTRRLRAAAVATATFVALTLLGWVVMPGASTDYWLHGLFLKSGRVASLVGPRYVSNQSLHGLATRLFADHDTAAGLLWVLSALAVAVAGMALAVWAYRRGEDLVGMLTVAFTGLLLSPIAWSHHWVWIAPLVIVMADVALRLRGRARTLAAGLPAAVIFVFVSWPIRADKTSPLLAQSLLWKAPNFHPDHDQRYGSPVQVVVGESYTLTAVGLFVLAAVWLRATRRRDVAAPPPATVSPSSATEPPRPATGARPPATDSPRPEVDGRVGGDRASRLGAT
jgi:alpha-1,2-mannosyltransferase